MRALVSHSLQPDRTEVVEHYRLHDRELLLTPLWARYIVPGATRWETFGMSPELAVAFARKILDFYDPEGIGA